MDNKTKAVGGKNTESVINAAVFTKEKLLASDRYKDKRDLLNALLADGKTYSRADVDALITEYLNHETEPAHKRRGRGKKGAGRTGRSKH